MCFSYRSSPQTVLLTRFPPLLLLISVGNCKPFSLLLFLRGQHCNCSHMLSGVMAPELIINVLLCAFFLNNRLQLYTGASEIVTK